MTGPFGTTPAKEWALGAYDETGGYDMMYAGISFGVGALDAADYEQPLPGNKGRDDWDMARMISDARAIAQIPAMLALVEAAMFASDRNTSSLREMARDIARELEVK